MLLHGRTHENHIRRRNPVTEDHLLSDSTDRKCPEEPSPHKQKADWWLPGAGGGAGEKGE